MGDWNFLGGILEEVHIHSTMVGKIWLTILFIFRMLVLGVAAEDVWNDEQADFICNTKQPGCRNVCYDRAFPISLIRYWVLQVIFVSSPSLVYMGHAIYQLRALEKERHCKKVALRRELEALDPDQTDARKKVEREMRQLEQGKLNKAPLRGSLLRTYIAHIVTRSVVEIGFMLGQHLIYGNQLETLYKCEREPCPDVVDCFVSRPTEKSVFMVFMQVIAAVSLFLSLLEILHLGYKKLKKGILDYYPHLKDDLDDCYGAKSKKNSVVHQVCISQGRKATIPTAPSGYTLLLEKQANGPAFLPLTSGSSAFLPIQGQAGGRLGQEGQKEGKKLVQSPTEGNNNSNNTSNEVRSHPDKPEQLLVDSQELETESSEYPTLPVTDSTSCPATCPTSGARRPRKVSGPRHCSTVLEGNASDSGESCSSSAAAGIRPCVGHPVVHGRPLPKQDFRRSSRPQTPDSVADRSSDSRQSPALSTNRRTSPASSGSSRRAATDLQI
ncbi:gap junction alpha-9 protein-like [Pygocentrus nattereri]|uniref:Gap junction protein n=1 Tax=Pygocentrus nattereri TaxID=42514 RepID=A0A3B4C173_PYGNA|nr:gap junction alpha-9 protein-like [Pygocentrus nattereri]